MAQPAFFTSSPNGRSSRAFSTEAAAHPANKTQIYLSRSADALLNLCVEYHLLQVTPPESTVLLLYVNAPTVVFGRSQNPWMEANLPLLARLARRGGGHTAPALGPVQLVRRRSGGGTVFHDAGNVNFGVICPSAAFNQDRYADMVVRALHALGRPLTRVNARHDIVVDGEGGTFKVSGSAYKKTSLRSLHHGTCLLRSPNLDAISGLLRSPAEPFIKAGGIESVRSPVGNLDLECADFKAAVVEQFRRMHGESQLQADFDDGALSVEGVRSGYEEMGSPKWTYGKTTRFTFCTHPFSEDPRPRPQVPFDLKVRFEAVYGQIKLFDVQGGGHRVNTSALVGHDFYRVRDWSERLAQAGLGDADAIKVGAWMSGVLGSELTSA
ncbi:hypothetical protein G6O67_007825 [Ophiocordyceps sinensis]|uniref:Putative lipoate-protein ligase A n=1 Tax=Ophiocordyceps sinensis TaxID=72228 RepID=A0A8H4PJY2_9HYPO|nr:hypothetical protein G6O67_007825 [Ophiocordyceps sinensis]